MAILIPFLAFSTIVHAQAPRPSDPGTVCELDVFSNEKLIIDGSTIAAGELSSKGYCTLITMAWQFLHSPVLLPDGKKVALKGRREMEAVFFNPETEAKSEWKAWQPILRETQYVARIAGFATRCGFIREADTLRTRWVSRQAKSTTLKDAQLAFVDRFYFTIQLTIAGRLTVDGKEVADQPKTEPCSDADKAKWKAAIDSQLAR
jgi:hypothetical protein